ncbi:MAG: hypothetical protein M1820_010690 [Bogoriella megaspora]|nr:MAG: hypothetical protein M1820_010690 [Bogoriella megaspora]
MATRVSGDFATICVGKTKENFIVSSELLTSHSPYFKAALSTRWKEGQTRKIELPEDEEDAFELYVRWLLTRQIWSVDIADDCSDKNTEDITEEMLLIRAYCLGEMVQDTEFKDAVLDALIEENTKFPIVAVDSLDYAWKHTRPGSPLRNFLSHYWVRLVYSDQLLDLDNSSNYELVKDLLAASIERIGELDGTGAENEIAEQCAEGHTCAYHEHGGSMLCYKRKRFDGSKESKDSQKADGTKTKRTRTD